MPRYPHDECPCCGEDLRGEKIPEDKEELFGEGYFRKEIGLYDMELDITIAYRCPNEECLGEWWRNGEIRKGPLYDLSNIKSIKP